MKKGMLRNEDGVSLVLLALSIVVLLGFGSLAIDVGHLYSVKNELQVAADAAALAAMSAVDFSDATAAQDDARDEAQRIALLNFADVAYNDGIPNTSPGEPIPVSLMRNDDNADPDGDIVVGNWNGAVFTPAPAMGFPSGGTVRINAVKVTARRTGSEAAGGAQPQVQNWFARVFALLGADLGFANVEAVAIAARDRLALIPIAVNEYWNEGGWVDAKGGKPGYYPAGNPYGQTYPQSFMRQTNADIPPTPGLAGTANNIFAVVGGDANKNNVSPNMNGYVNILFRNSYHNAQAHPDQWHQINTATANGTCASCDTDVTDLPPTGLTNSQNQAKFDEIFSYLFNGMPGNLLPPIGVREIIRTMPAYTGDNYNEHPNANDPSECPFSTVAYFSGSGNLPGLPQGPGGQRFYERWPAGSRFMVMVYDGTGYESQGNQAGTVTVVGYGLIEIDGYLSSPFSGNKADLKASGNTAYGHALPHNVPGEEDPYLIQPTDADRTPDCTFAEKLNIASEINAPVRLVDPNLKYGVHTAP